ncbi:MAG: exodeoxyribonuclease III [Bacillota bacterium]|jgi:exodeoxyribonuclease-3
MSSLKLLSWNVNGLRAAAKKGFWQHMQSLNPDIICLQEIKTKKEQLQDDLLKPEGWQAYLYPAQRAGYSGVAIYSKRKPENVRYGIGIERFDAEGRTLTLDYQEFCLVNAYFPNGGRNDERLQYKLDFCEAIQEFVLSIKRPVLLCGDFNTAHQERDLARPRENLNNSGFMPIERAWIERFLAAGFVDTFRLFYEQGGFYSWWDLKTRARERNTGWRIDYFFAAKELQSRIKSAFILPEITGSDHCPVGIELDI